MQDGLKDAVREVKAMGFRVGLHTGGAYPQKLEALLPLIDWVGLDIKAPFSRYASVNGVPGSGAKAKASLRHIVESGVDHECRTTVHPAQFTQRELVAFSETLFKLGARRHVLQAFRAEGCLDAALLASHDAVVLSRLLAAASAASPRVELRGV